MPLINLIQEQRDAVRRRQRRTRTYLAALVCVAGLSAVASGFLYIEAGRSERAEMLARDDLRRLEPLEQQLKRNEQLLAVYGPKLETLSTAQKGTERWARILDGLGYILPTQCWLTGIRSVQGDSTKPVTMSLTGLSADQDRVGELLLSLRQLVDLQGVQLKYTQEKLVDERKGIEFEIGADVADTGQKKAVRDESSKEKA